MNPYPFLSVLFGIEVYEELRFSISWLDFQNICCYNPLRAYVLSQDPVDKGDQV